MPIEDDINEFRLWATKLGCPQDAMPNEEALKSIFKSRQRDLFCNLMRRVQSRQEVQEIRENILITQMEKIKDRVVPVHRRSCLPREIQIYLKMKDLQDKQEKAERLLEENKKEYDTLAASIKTKNIQTISSQHKRRVLESKVNLFAFRSEALDKELQKEERNKQQIMATMPTKLTAQNNSAAAASESVLKALKELDQFYEICVSNTNPNTIKEAKDKLWLKIRAIFSNIPNFLIFNAVMRLKEEQLQHIVALSKANTDDSHGRTLSAVSNKEPLTPFEKSLLKTKGDLLGMVAKYLSARQERILMEERFLNAYATFEEELLQKVNLFNADAEEECNDEIIRTYIIQYNSRNFTRSQNEFLAQQIELYKMEIASAGKHLENHEVLLGSIKEVYSEISASVNRIQYEVMQLSQIKEKIIYSRNMLKHQFDDLEASTCASSVKSNFLPAKLKINANNNTEGSGGGGGGGGGVGATSNLSLLSGDSFEVSNDNVFCSTKLDFDTTMLSLNNLTLRRSSCTADSTLLPQAGGGKTEGHFTLPSYSVELNTFAELPLEHLSCVPKECAFYLSPNPLIVESRELSSTVQLAPGVLLTPFGALQEVRNRIVWAELIAAHSNDLKLSLDLFLVDPKAFKQKSKQQCDQITETLDRINTAALSTKHTLQKISKLYDFIIENPLRHYIPASRTFNNQTFADYEAEFIMYYRMATTGISIK